MDVKNNSLINTFQINKKDIITIVGAGGKTSLMLSASSYLRKDYKVLVTTTTHIYMPEKKYYDEMIVVSEDEDNKKNKDSNNLLLSVNTRLFGNFTQYYLLLFTIFSIF